MYADAFGLLVSGAPLTSVSLSKNKFFDRLKKEEAFASSFCAYRSIQSLIFNHACFCFFAFTMLMILLIAAIKPKA